MVQRTEAADRRKRTMKLRTRRSWWARREAHVFADAPLFRVLARRWKPLADVRREPPPLPLSPADAPHVSRAWFTGKPRYPDFIAQAKEKPRPAWNPWLWVK
jgi:hypothetical protein